MAKFRRVLLRLSSGAFGGGTVGLDPLVVRDITGQIATTVRRGVEVAVIVDDGNFFRGASPAQADMDRSRANYMGILRTVMNALAFQDSIEQAGVPARVQSAITMTQVAKPYIPLRAIRHLEKGRVVIFGAGAGIPYFSTGTVPVQRTLETHCDELLAAKNGVDGVYDDDPRTNPEAKKLDFVTYSDTLAHELKVADSIAPALCRDNGFKTWIFGMSEPGNVTAAPLGERIGTLITADS